MLVCLQKVEDKECLKTTYLTSYLSPTACLLYREQLPGNSQNPRS